MFLIILLYSTVIVVISANNVIPVQTYPTYQQNGYINPPAYQLNDIQPYIQGVTAQNQLQQTNVSPSSIKQALLNKLLTSPTVQTALDPNARNYNSNWGGIQSYQIPGNLVNNYMVVPADYLNNNTGNTNIERVTNEGKNTERTEQRRKKSKSRRKHKQTKNNDDVAYQITSNKNRDAKCTENLTENDMISRKSTRKRNRHYSIQENLDGNVENDNRNKKAKRRKNKEEDQTIENPVLVENKVQSPKSRKRRKKQKLKNTNDTENGVSIKNKVKEINENVDLDITDEGMNNENRMTRNSKQEANDILKPVPNAPKEINNQFMTNLNNFNNPMLNNWFASYENLFQSLLAQQPKTKTNETRPKKRKKPKRGRKHHKRKHTHNKNSTEAAKAVSSNKVDSTNAEKIVYINERIETDSIQHPVEETSFGTVNKNTMYSSNEIFRDGYSVNDFEEKYDTGYYGGYIDDYYPLFTDSAAYNANNKEIILKNLNDNKYYYAMDRFGTDIENIHPKTSHDHSELFLEDYERNKHTYDDTEKESIKNAYKKEFEEKIEFRTPPLLELPDFRTRQIDKSEIRPEIYYTYDDSSNGFAGDKSSTYSSAKTPNHAGTKHNEIKTQPKDVETVYARSKVISYGPVYIPEEDNSPAGIIDAPWTDYSIENNKFQNGEITYVLAKSLNPDISW